jgi:DNA topoisomerase IB
MRRDPTRAALHHVEAGELTIRRRRNGHGFAHVQPNGRPLRDKRTLIRLKRLAVPPAYEDVVAVVFRLQLRYTKTTCSTKKNMSRSPRWRPRPA